MSDPIRPNGTFDSVLRRLLCWADSKPDELAFEVDGDSVTWSELERRVRSWAGALRSFGVGPGSRCAIGLPTGLDQIGILFGVQLLRAAPVVVNPSLSFDAMLRRLDRIGCDVIVVADGGSGVSREELVSPSSLRRIDAPPVTDVMPEPDDIAYLQLTSGTTGDPKAAVILQRNLTAYLDNGGTEFRGDEIVVSWMPLFHDLGLVLSVFATVHFGARTHLLQPSLGNLQKWLAKIGEVNGTYTAAPDFAFRIASRIVDPEGIDLGSLRIAFNGGEPVRVSTIRAFENRFGISRVVQPGYGLAEATLGIARALPGQPLIEMNGHVSCGPPREGLEVKVVTPSGAALPPGQPGEILAKGDQIFAGYLDDVEATNEVLRDGWLHTGDLGMLDEQGHVYVLGRMRAMIKRAGSTIAPREIEEIVDALAGVRASAAVGIPSDDGTERVVVVAEAGRDAGEPAGVQAQIIERVQTSLGFAPDQILVVPPRTIPLTESGKIRYGELRDSISTGSLSGTEGEASHSR